MAKLCEECAISEQRERAGARRGAGVERALRAKRENADVSASRLEENEKKGRWMERRPRDPASFSRCHAVTDQTLFLHTSMYHPISTHPRLFSIENDFQLTLCDHSQIMRYYFDLSFTCFRAFELTEGFVFEKVCFFGWIVEKEVVSVNV